jgi:hemerythrin-like domain-containing protein
MDLIPLLMSEHRLIEKVLDALAAYAESAAQGQAVDGAQLVDFVEFLRGYADAIHHGKEEDILFAGLRLQGCPEEVAPMLDSVQREHETGRNLMDDLAAIARRPRPWSPADRTRLRRTALDYVWMLRRHIADEDQRVFPQTQGCLSAESARSVEKACAHFEAMHAKRRAELQRLADKLTGGR